MSGECETCFEHCLDCTCNHDIKLDQHKSDTNMKWENDPLRYEKHLMLDTIIAFSKKFDGKDFGSISIKDVADFIDNFFNIKNMAE